MPEACAASEARQFTPIRGATPPAGYSPILGSARENEEVVAGEPTTTYDDLIVVECALTPPGAPCSGA